MKMLTAHYRLEFIVGIGVPQAPRAELYRTTADIALCTSDYFAPNEFVPAWNLVFTFHIWHFTVG